MLRDAQRCVDDLSAICRDAYRQAGQVAGRLVGGAGPDAIRAENVARDVARWLANAHAAGLDVGAAMSRLLADAGVTDDVALRRAA